MAGKTVSIMLTPEQQRQIQAVTGQNLTKLNINLSPPPGVVSAAGLVNMKPGRSVGADATSLDLLTIKPW
jgi:hypothetical protein